MEPFDICIVADDLTGAADTGLAFWRVGLPVQIRFVTSGSQLNAPILQGVEPSVQVISTESRHASAEDAGTLLQEVGKGMLSRPGALLFKKIDSTLRGWVGVEIRALLDTLPGRIAWIIPSYPKLGRSMENGLYSVRGVPLASTEFAREINGCPADSRIASLLERQMLQPPGFVGREIVERGPEAIAARVHELTKSRTSRAVLFDAASDNHIAHIVAAGSCADNHPLWVGSAGLASPLAERCARNQGQPPPVPGLSVAHASGGTVVIAAGSRHPVTRQQVAFLRTRMPLLSHVVSGNPDEVFSPIGAKNILLRLPEPGPTSGTADPLAMAARLGEEAAKAIRRTGSRGMVLTGGDIAAATCRSLNVDALEIIGAIEEGIPLLRLRGGMADGAFAVTKAGGFGTEESLYRAVKLLQGTYE